MPCLSGCRWEDGEEGGGGRVKIWCHNLPPEVQRFFTLAARQCAMWEWLLWGHQSKPRARQLTEMVDRLLDAGPQAGEHPFPLSEKELKRLCSAARWVLQPRGLESVGTICHPQWARKLLPLEPLIAGLKARALAATQTLSACLAGPARVQTAPARHAVRHPVLRRPLAGRPCSRSPPCWRSAPPPRPWWWATCTASSPTCSASLRAWAGRAAMPRCGCSWGTTSTAVSTQLRCSGPCQVHLEPARFLVRWAGAAAVGAFRLRDEAAAVLHAQRCWASQQPGRPAPTLVQARWAWR